MWYQVHTYIYSAFFLPSKQEDLIRGSTAINCAPFVVIKPNQLLSLNVLITDIKIRWIPAGPQQPNSAAKTDPNLYEFA